MAQYVNVVASENAKYIYDFARYVNGADITRLENVIMASKNAEYIYIFARDIECADIHKLWKAIVATRNREYICKFKEYFGVKRFLSHSYKK